MGGKKGCTGFSLRRKKIQSNKGSPRKETGTPVRHARSGEKEGSTSPKQSKKLRVMGRGENKPSREKGEHRRRGLPGPCHGTALRGSGKMGKKPF